MPIQHDVDFKAAKALARSIIPLRDLSRSVVRTLNPSDELLFLRIKTKKHEFFVSYNEHFTIISTQNNDIVG